MPIMVTSAAHLNGRVKYRMPRMIVCTMNMTRSDFNGLRLAALPPIILPMAMATPYNSRMIAIV
ncbi:hypothetical protein D3C75_1308790 [compost metagenome]